MKLTTALLGAALASLLTIPAANAATASPLGCMDKGSSNYYLHIGDSVDPGQILGSPYVFREQKCVTHGFRLFKSRANTKAEANFQRKYLREDTANSKKPVIYCRPSKTRAHFLDLAFYWGIYGAKHLNRAERTHYTRWTHAYVRRHPTCRLFVPRR